MSASLRKPRVYGYNCLMGREIEVHFPGRRSLTGIVIQIFDSVLKLQDGNNKEVLVSIPNMLYWRILRNTRQFSTFLPQISQPEGEQQ